MAIMRITAWSYSRLKDWERCPFAAKCKHLLKLKEPPNAAMSRGIDVDTKANQFVEGKLRKLPEELSKFKKEFEYLKKVKAQTQGEWAFTAQWIPTDWRDWAAAWLRVKLDVFHTEKKGVRGVAIDNKTGKHNPERIEEYHDQLKLYAPTAMIMEPATKEVVARIHFLDAGKTEERTYPRKDLEKLKRYWEGRAKGMLGDTTFPPRPGYYCRWCHYRKANGGPCQY